MIKLEGRVQYRSSARPSGPPGEAEIQRLNPRRVTQILEVTGWAALEPGSLNLTVSDEALNNLLRYTPVLVELGESIIYPDRYQHIPKLRGEYYYYLGVVSVGKNSQEILVRRAKNPVPNRMELFAPVNLTKYFKITEGDNVTVNIKGSKKGI